MIDIVCPGCARPLHLPESVIGSVVHCPHCRISFESFPASGDTPLTLRVRRADRRIPRALLAPTFGLLLIGFAGLIVNGNLCYRFAFVPEADIRYAKAMVIGERAIRDNVASGNRPTGEHDVRAAVASGVAAEATRVIAEEYADSQRAEQIAPQLLRKHLPALGFGFFTVLGGLSILVGRFRPLAFLGCFAAALNINEQLCCLPGAIVGFWGILRLVHDEGKAYFDRRS